jgi:hypothetical protein
MGASLDIVPASVRINNRAYGKVRVVVSDGKVHILSWQNKQAVVLASAEIAECLPCNGGPRNVIITSQGERFDISRGGCSCGLKDLAGADWRSLV